MPSFLIQTLGCKLNQLESEAVISAFLSAGFNPFTQEDISPSVIIINTCTVTSKADQKARRVIRKALRDYPDSRVVATGCYAQLNKDDILKLENDDKKRLYVVGKDNILNFPHLLNGGAGSRDLKSDLFQFNPEQFSRHTRSFLKIQDGCDRHCTYCRIRLARGASVSLARDEVLSRLRILERDHAESVLTGVNISQYCDKNGDASVNLAGLLEYLLNGTDKIAVRLSSLAPDSIDEKLAPVLSNKRIRPHFHLSIQSGSDVILRKMGRCYNAQTAEKAVNLLRSAKCDPFLACDIIAGFPGETEEEFKKTYEFCKKNDFAWIHVFPYSKRQGTPAFSYKNTIHDREISERVQRLTGLARQGRADYVKRWLGREVDILTENTNRKENGNFANTCYGTSENYLKLAVKTKSSPPFPGTLLRCKLIEQGTFKDFDAIAHEV